MCRMSALAATALAFSLAGAAPVAAFPFGGKSKEGAQAPAAPEAPVAAPDAIQKATDQERALATGLDPLSRAAFWAREVNIDPTDIEAGLGLARALRGLGQTEEAAASVQRLAVLAPDNVEVLLELARAQLARGEGFYGVAPALQAQTLAPGDWRAPFLLAMAYEQAQRDTEALAAHRRAVQLAPNNPAVLSNLAMFQAARGQAAEAEALLRQAAALPGATAVIRQNLALILGLQGRISEAEALARQDLPPQLVANNLAYLRSASQTAATGGSGRSWESVGSVQ